MQPALAQPRHAHLQLRGFRFAFPAHGVDHKGNRMRPQFARQLRSRRGSVEVVIQADAQDIGRVIKLIPGR